MTVSELLDAIALAAPDPSAQVFFDAGPDGFEVQRVDFVRIDQEGALVLF